MELVSVVIPCYKQSQFLGDCLESLQAQSHPLWEAIIVNDGSPDNTREVALDYCSKDRRIRYIEQCNLGACEARNAGLREARGSFIQFLDADDKLEFDKFRSQLDFFKQHPEIDLVFGDARYFTTERPELRDFGVYAKGKEEPWIPALWHDPGEGLEKLLSHNLFPINCPLTKHEVFKTVGKWNPHLERLQDWEYWIRCAAANTRMHFLDAPNSMALIRWHSASVSHDAAKGHRSGLAMRISVGHAIKNSHLREKNFEAGLRQLLRLNPETFIKPLAALTYANITPIVLVTAIRFMFERIHMQRRIKALYKKRMPWPIQKTVSKMWRYAFRRK